jgi:hypothetical protein
MSRFAKNFARNCQFSRRKACHLIRQFMLLQAVDFPQRDQRLLIHSKNNESKPTPKYPKLRIWVTLGT